MNDIEHLAAFIAGLRREAIAAPLLDRLRMHVVDIIGAWIAATTTAEGRALIAFRNAPSLGGDVRGSLADDLALHCALARLSEVDDIHLASMTTPGSVVIPAAMTLAAALPDADDIVPAIVGGYEAMIRLGEAINGPQVLYRGIWPTYFGAPVGTAAVAARLLRLDKKQTAHALALAITVAAPSVGQHHAATTARWFSVGNAARNGLAAALAARAGFTGDVNMLNSRLFPDVFGINLDLTKLSGLSAEAPRFAQLSFKPWCAARQTMAATQALRELVDEGVSIEQVEKIIAAVPPPHFKMINHGIRGGDRASFLTSLSYQMACAVLQPDRMLDLGFPGEPPAQALQSIMSRIEVVPDGSLLADYPVHWPARVSVLTRNGKWEKFVRDVPGDPQRPLSDAELKQKFRRLVEPCWGEERASGLETVGSAVLHSSEALLGTVKAVKECMNGAAIPRV